MQISLSCKVFSSGLLSDQLSDLPNQNNQSSIRPQIQSFSSCVTGYMFSSWVCDWLHVRVCVCVIRVCVCVLYVCVCEECVCVCEWGVCVCGVGACAGGVCECICSVCACVLVI